MSVFSSKRFLLFFSLASLIFTCHSFGTAKLYHHFALSKIQPTKTTITSTTNRSRKTALFLSSKEKTKGVYARPSAAIERGSGFFVPGLEGSKVRILFGALVLILNAINHQVSVNAKLDEVGGFALSEKIASFYGVFLLFQGLIEFGKEIGLGFDGVEDSTTIENYVENEGEGSRNNEPAMKKQKGVEQYISPQLTEMGEDASETVCWAAATYLSLTPATHVMLLSKSLEKDGRCGTLYRLGNFQSIQKDQEEIQKSIEAAVDTVYKSKGGRVSIPSDHPGAMVLPEYNRRCVLLQQVDVGQSDQFCFLVGSDQLLPTFTKNDLKWLGILGRYISEKFS